MRRCNNEAIKQLISEDGVCFKKLSSHVPKLADHNCVKRLRNTKVRGSEGKMVLSLKTQADNNADTPNEQGVSNSFLHRRMTSTLNSHVAKLTRAWA